MKNVIKICTKVVLPYLGFSENKWILFELSDASSLYRFEFMMPFNKMTTGSDNKVWIKLLGVCPLVIGTWYLSLNAEIFLPNKT